MYNKNYGYKQTEESKYKAKIRNRKAFKDFKEKGRLSCKSTDFITGKKLGKKWNFHHLDQRIENYERFEADRFICLGLQMHETVHYLYRYYEKDPAIIDRLKLVLEKMKEFSND